MAAGCEKTVRSPAHRSRKGVEALPVLDRSRGSRESILYMWCLGADNRAYTHRMFRPEEERKKHFPGGKVKMHGMVLDPEKCRKFLSAKFDRLKISMDKKQNRTWVVTEGVVPTTSSMSQWELWAFGLGHCQPEVREREQQRLYQRPYRLRFLQPNTSTLFAAFSSSIRFSHVCTSRNSEISPMTLFVKIL